jgi:hypothetical protein
MTAKQQFLEVIQGLLEKTKDGKVQWKEEAGKRDSYFFRVKGSAIRLTLVSPTAEADYIAVEFIKVPEPDHFTPPLPALFPPPSESLEKGGKVVASWKIQDDEIEWQFVHELFEEARRTALGFDKVLKDFETFLKA